MDFILVFASKLSNSVLSKSAVNILLELNSVLLPAASIELKLTGIRFKSDSFLVEYPSLFFKTIV